MSFTVASPRGVSTTPRRVVVTVSGTIGADTRVAIAEGRRPRADYDELSVAMDAEVVDYASARAHTGRIGRLLARFVGDDVALAWTCVRRRKALTAVFSDSERVGMIYAALCLPVRRRPRHVMIGHRLAAPAKLRLHKLVRLGRRIDRVIVYSSAQRTVAVDQLGYPPDRVTLTPFMVDTRFWRADDLSVPPRGRPLICAVGQELRDYPTLVAAVGDLDVDVVIAAASPWSRRADSSSGLVIPDNVSVERLDLFQLRQLYAEATLVVVPLVENDFQAGITTILEAMSMGLAVVCTRTEGQTDTLVDGDTGRYVAPGDPDGLRAAVSELLADDDMREGIGRRAQQWVRTHADVEVYAARLAAIVGTADAPS